MKPGIKKLTPSKEFETAERCFITEIANDLNDTAISIARARVAPGMTTQRHQLRDVSERYIITSGQGRVEVGELPPTDVDAGDVVQIPPNTPQRITNTGTADLIFFAVCSPRFTPECYQPA